MLAVELHVPGSSPRRAKMVKNTVKNDLCIAVPPYFKCPISLDIMKSPVSLSTGVTYDRSSIQKWLDDGNNTCPATMQILQSKEIIPNYTLRRLIQVWSVSNQISANSPDSSATSSQNLNNNNNSINNNNSLAPREAKDILQELRDGAVDSDMVNALLKFAAESEKNRDSLVRAGAVPVLVEILSLPEKDKDSGQISRKMTEIHAQVVKILGFIPHNESTVRIVAAPEPLRSIITIFRTGSPGAKIEAASLLESLLIDGEMKSLIASREGLVEALLSLTEASNDSPRTTEASLRCLLSLCAPKRNRLRIVRLGAVGHMTRLLLSLPDGDNSERILALLELLSACADGRNSICEQSLCIPAVVQKMLKVSDVATEHCVIILWAVCCVSSDQRARDAVVKAGGLTKILLLMQSNCSPAVRQMAGDLLKILRQMSKNFIPNYDSKMTHIMPF